MNGPLLDARAQAAAAGVEAVEDARKRRAMLHILEDLKRERDALGEARRQWVRTVDALPQPLLVHDAEGNVVRANRAYAAQAGMTFNDMAGRAYWQCFPKQAGPIGDGTRVLVAIGEEAYSITRSHMPETGLTLCLFDDVTAEHRAMAQSTELARIAASELIFSGEVEALARQVTEAAARLTGAARANVWLFNADETVITCIDLFDSAAATHSAGGELSQAQFQNEFAALKSARYVDASDALNDPRTAGYLEAYLKPLGITSMLDAVIAYSGRHLGLLCLEHVGRAHVWQPDEIDFACQLADKMALAITSRNRKAAEKGLRESLEGTIAAIAATMESRDPYTAGHQRRVADLAAAIAREMGLAGDLVQGLHFGALIHDLGKIQVPAELLAKPTRLTKLELELIKTHAQAGYEIVKHIRFPWKVAEMVHQHHERLDGSGYPQGLKGDAIALEARILAVADVAEAMSSHRPYRPGLGVDVALAEIEAKRGIWYEPAAVDACVRLFREKGYTFGNTGA